MYPSPLHFLQTLSWYLYAVPDLLQYLQSQGSKLGSIANLRDFIRIVPAPLHALQIIYNQFPLFWMKTFLKVSRLENSE